MLLCLTAKNLVSYLRIIGLSFDALCFLQCIQDSENALNTE
jgi:hypothetical protein